jgi:carbon storage regulator
MLVLGRTEGTGITIGDDIHIQILSISEFQIRVGITAPDDVVILRDELIERNQSRGRDENGDSSGNN